MNTRRKHTGLMVLCLALLLGCIREGLAWSAGDGPVVRMRPCSTPPVIDGKIGPEEWRDALIMQGCANHLGNILDPRRAWAYVTFDRDNLYLAVRTETQPGNMLRSWPLRPGVADWTQDASELWIAPLSSPGEAPIDRFQIWLNPHDGKWGMVHRYGVGFTFKGAMAYANRLQDDFWSLEAAIPWKDLGVDPAAVKHGMHFLVRPTRNWSWHQYTSWGYSGAFVEPASMVRVIVDQEAPVVQADHLGDPAQGNLDMMLKIRNPGAAKAEYRVSLKLFENPSQTERNLLAGEERVVSVGPGQTTTVSLKKDFDFGEAQRSPYHPSHLLATVVTRTADNAICYQRQLGFAPPLPRDKAWPPLPPRPVRLTGGYYPYYGKVRAEIDRGDLPRSEEVTRVVVRVMKEDGEKVLGQGEITHFEYNRGETIIEVGALPEGKYRMAAEVYAGDEKLEHQPVQSFERLTLPWERNTLGISDTVYPPFTPLAVKDRAVACVLRNHTVNGAGLWDQVVSMGKPVLAGPMRLEGRNQGKALAWTMPAAPRFLEKAGHRVVHEGSMESEVLSVRSLCTWDYDGMMKVELELEPRGTGELDELALVFPLRKEEAGLMHATTFIRANPAMAIPEGEGVVWDSRGMVKGLGLGSFTPYIWIGGPERGICWFADNDRGWITRDDEAAFQIVRAGDEVQLRVRLINAPTRVQGSRGIVFGIQASPVKPQPKGFRGWSMAPGSRNIGYAMASLYFAGLSDCESLDPLKGDWRVVGKLAEAQKSKKPDYAWIEQWLKGHNVSKGGVYGGLWQMTPDLFRRAAGPDELVIYSNPCYEGGATPQRASFGTEWGPSGSVRMTPSYVDYAVWCFDQMFAHGFQGGIYHDNTFPIESDDLVAGNAYVRDDGAVQSGWDMFGHRALYKRLYATAWARTGRYPLIAVHLTNGNNIPYFSFATIGSDLEMEYGTDRTFQEKFSFALLQIESTGKQAGLVPGVMTIMGGGPLSKALPGDSDAVKAEKRAFADFLARTRKGVCLLHDILPVGWQKLPPYSTPYKNLAALGFADEATEFLPYWSNQEVVSTDRDRLEVSLYTLGANGVLAVACSISDAGRHAIKLNLDKLGLPKDVLALDLELEWSNQDPAQVKARQAAGLPDSVEPASPLRLPAPGEVEFELARHDYRLILFRPPAKE